MREAITMRALATVNLDVVRSSALTQGVAKNIITAEKGDVIRIRLHESKAPMQ